MAASSSDSTSKQDPTPRRKFAVEPVETTSRSSKEGDQKQDKEQSTEKPRRRFAPEPVEESTRSSKDASNGEHKTRTASNGTTEKKPRKFAVQPVETVKRARRRNTGNALLPGDETDATPGATTPRTLKPETTPPPPVNTPFNESAVGPSSPPESRFSYANLAKHASRQSSMRRPSLDPISSVPESDESNLSKPSSTATSESMHAEAHSHRDLKPAGPRQKNLQKESYDEVFNGYLLNMAAQQAQQQLREQAADAYPNERIHQPVDHFAADRESDSDTEIGTGQLPKGPEINVQGEDDKKAAAGSQATDFQKLKATLGNQLSPSSAPKKDPFGAAFNMAGIGAEASEPRDPEIRNMREVARPPMLGGSLVFPKCPSPKMTQIDPLQRHGTRREAREMASRPQSGLWTPGGSSPVKRESPKATLSLWGGNCTADQAQRFNFPSNPQPQMGLMTPSTAPDEDPFTRWNNDEQLQGQLKKQHQLQSNPGSRVNSVLGIDQLLAMEQKIADEYNDGFVTQIYNYLSLGYPGIARIYDDELAKISKIPVETIRADDSRKNTKGYVAAPEGDGADEDDVKTHCGRWRALRLYIHEWARQQPYMLLDGEGQNWGGAARRGSWFS